MGVSRFVVVPAAYVYLLRGGSVLLQRRAGTGFMDGHWAAAAGHVEEGESAPAAAVREAREEVGVSVRAGDLVPLCAMHRRHSEAPIDQRVDFFFSCSRWAGEPALQEPDKADDLGWFDLTALPAAVVPHERVVLERLSAGALPPVLTHGF
ncbi:MAG TPA: NUDIX domain-containing protein [Nocardioidaceae bacterium]|nr:NUDIX domain-containing protein [Nocardioidaceae bacterium]